MRKINVPKFLRQGSSIRNCAVLIAGIIVSASASETFAQNTELDPAKVIGNNDCKECHGNELKALQASKHHGSLALLKANNAQKYADELGVKDILGDSICARCHATPAGNPAKATISVSCESCHGPAMDWIKDHKTLKGNAAGLRAMVRAKAKKAGMISPEHIYGIAKNCFQCHVVGNEKLVEAGHPATTKYDLELVGGSGGEVRHNFQVDQKKNALAPSLWMKLTGNSVDERRRVKYVVGTLVDLEVSLANIAKAKNLKKEFAKANKKRYVAAADRLQAIADKLNGDTPQTVTDALAALKAVGKVSKFGSLKKKNQDGAKKAQPDVAKAAKASGELKGKDLAALDDLIKSGNKKPKVKKVSERGKAFKP